ncbi:MAG TPA: thiamine pyrophosphate-dependent enzyme [Acidobacteriaceae bacterium]
MAENPLLPHRRLQELHALMLRCRDLDRTNARKNAGKNPGTAGIAREGLLAAAAIQMEPGDMLCGEAGDSTVEELFLPQAAVSKKKSKAPGTPELPTLSQLTLCIGMARGLQASGSKGVVLALTSAGTSDPAWQNSMTYAQTLRLPIIFLCLDATGGKVSKRAANPLTWLVAQKFAKNAHLPMLAVDGEDAVAVYRVVQESLIRARSGDGPALAWCVLNKRDGKGRSRPVTAMEKYLAVRGLKPNLRAV